MTTYDLLIIVLHINIWARLRELSLTEECLLYLKPVTLRSTHGSVGHLMILNPFVVRLGKTSFHP